MLVQQRRLSMFICFVIICFSLSACKNEVDGDHIVKIAGSTSVAPLMKKLETAYENEFAGTYVEIQESGSSAGINAVIEGACQIGMSSRNLTEAELANGLEVQVLALDGICVIINPENSVQDLSIEQIRLIFSGEITNWKEVGGEDWDIICVSREEGAGTRSSFEKLVGLEEEIVVKGKKEKTTLLSKDALIENSTGGVKSDVIQAKNAIGYVSMGTLDESVRAVSVEGKACTEENILNEQYVLSRSFLICTKGKQEAIVQQYIDFLFSDYGQSVIRQTGYIPLA